MLVVLATPSLASAGGVNYVTNTQTGQSIVPGTTDVGNDCDDFATLVNFPFTVSVYGASYSSGYSDRQRKPAAPDLGRRLLFRPLRCRSTASTAR